ncbi:NTP transferase domain-containing protein [Janibacter anophelis]|uniref:nucleotidyltransferase family protein n=1 Tax=Janibacter anophelis TaxID=319054 RepID=UPI00082A0DA5|nr:nucleotidyltransferase family protein [Janibacter anophelis]
MVVHGLLLAAGAGRRMGMPKALKRDRDGTSWLVRSVEVLHDGGCAEVTVVLGASGPAAEVELPGTSWTHCGGWAEGIGASLAHGLRTLAEGNADAALVHLVDLPDVTAQVATRVVGEGVRRDALRRAVYSGVVGHPVLIGRDHWAPLVAELAGDTGAGPYLRRQGAVEVECGDLASGVDVDRPD